MESGVSQNQPELTDAAASSTTIRPDHIESADDIESSAFVASQWTLMWWRFRKHKLAIIGGIVTLIIYVIVVFAEFFAPFPADKVSTQLTYAPPQTLVLFDEDGFNPHVFGYISEVDPVALR